MHLNIQTTTKHIRLKVYLLLLIMTLVMMFFYSPLSPGGDFFVHYNRLSNLMDALKNGIFPFYMDYEVINGYGYLIKAFYCDVLLIPFAILGNLTSGAFAYKAIIFTSTFLCGIFTYECIYRINKNILIAIIAALLYTFCTYRIFDIYIREALGEFLSFTWLPLVLLGTYELLFGNYKKKWYLFTLAYVLLIFTHVISTVLTSFVLILFLIRYYKQLIKEPKRILYFALASATCIPLTAYYIFPMLEQMNSNSFYYETHQLVKDVTGYKLNEVVSGLFNGVSLRNEEIFPKLGSFLTFIVLTRIFLISKIKAFHFYDTCLIIGIFLLAMTLPQFPWYIPPFSLLKVIQFPWRLLEYTSFLFAIAGAYYLSHLLTNKKQILVGISAIIGIYILIFNSDSIHYKTFIHNNKYEIKVNTSFLGMIGGEYLPSKIPSNNYEYTIPGVYNDYLFFRGGDSIKTIYNDSKILDYTKKQGNLNFRIETLNTEVLELPYTYYLGYEIKLNSEPLKYVQSDNGLIEIHDINTGNIVVKYTGTYIQKISYYISIISLLIFISYIIFINKKKKRNV